MPLSFIMPALPPHLTRLLMAAFAVIFYAAFITLLTLFSPRVTMLIAAPLRFAYADAYVMPPYARHFTIISVIHCHASR